MSDPKAERRSELSVESGTRTGDRPVNSSDSSPLASAQLTERLTRVKLLLCDVDGILTDASVFMGGGVESKRFNIRDGLGLRLLQKCGVKVGWISARPSDATKQRADDLRIDFLVQLNSSKVEATAHLLAANALRWDEVCFMGDDLVDLGMLKRAGVAVAVPDGLSETRAMAHYITRAPGGHGAVREVVEMILKAQGHWPRLVEEFSA